MYYCIARYSLYIAFSATLYTIVIFTLCHYLGKAVGDKLEVILPVSALTFLAIFGGII